MQIENDVDKVIALADLDRWKDSFIPLPRLLPWEHFVNVKDIPLYTPTIPPSSIRQLQRLARVKTEEEIGSFGPPMAAIALEREEHQEISEELRLYEATFGRDSLITGEFTLHTFPRLMKVSIRKLAELQGTTYDIPREEEPGRIIHEDRKEDDENALMLSRERGWGWPYYGAVDSTPLFLRGIYKYINIVKDGEKLLDDTYTDREGHERTIGYAYEQALAWVERKMGENEEGVIEYKSTIKHGLENQVWRDSYDSYHHADGTLANHDKGVASLEVQQIAYDALLESAVVYEIYFNNPEKAAELRDRAAKLKQTIIDRFWCDEKGGYFVIGTDRDEHNTMRQLQIRTSDMGHLLDSSLLIGEDMRGYREATVMQLFSEELLTTGGFRTLASDELRYRPGAYHNGNVWLWQTYRITQGLAHHGLYGLAHYMADQIRTVINVTQRFPEYIRGDSDDSPRLNNKIVDVWDSKLGKYNRLEQPPQEVQAWTVAAEIAREFFSGKIPPRAIDVRARSLEDSIFALLEAREAA